MSANAAADSLKKAVAQGSLGMDIDKTVTETYQGVGADMALLLLLQAANCESDRGNEVGAAQVRELARIKILQQENLATNTETKKVEAAPAALTPTEDKLLEGSPLKEEIEKELETQAEVTPDPNEQLSEISDPVQVSIVKTNP